jgi:APA family basic amino acid/polyamine antiporter
LISRVVVNSTLPRQLGLFQVVTYGIGNIVGAGIYVLVGDAAGLAGSSIWLSFLIGAVVAGFTGLTYAELSSMYPRAASEYIYVGRAYGSRLLSFVTEWTMLITEIVAASAVSIGFASYVKAIFGTPVLPVAIILLLSLTVIASAGAEYWLKINTVLSIVAIAGLIIVILLGLTSIARMQYAPPQGGMAGIIGAAILVFFAYIGFDNMSNIAEDTKNPETTIPRGLIIAIVVTTILYVLVGLSAVSLVAPALLSSSDAPLALAASSKLGVLGFYMISAIALMTTMNTVQVLVIVSSRIIYGMAKEHALPSMLSYVSRNTRTPLLAIAMVFIIALAFLPLSSASAIARVTSFGSLVTFALVNIALLHLRRTTPNVKRPFKAPFNIGWFSLTAAMGLVFCLALLFQFDLQSIVLGLLLPVSGAIIYLAFRIEESGEMLHEPHTR